MQSSIYPVPRCVLAQTFLDNINNRSSSESSSGGSSGSSSDEDRNTDVDERYQQSPNRLQGRQQEYRHVHHHHHNPQHRQHQYAQQYHCQQRQQVQHRDGVTDLPLPSPLSVASDGLAMTVGGGGTGDCNDAPHPVPGISSNKNYAQDRQHYHHSQQHKMHDQQSYLHHRSGTNQHLGSSPSHSGNSMPSQKQHHLQQQQQQQQRNVCYPHSSSSVSSSSNPCSGAYQHPPPQQQQNNHHYSSYAHSHMSRLEAMFPPLHDNEKDMDETLEHKPAAKRPDHPTLDQMLNTLKATTASAASDCLAGPRAQSTNNTIERELSRRSAPPPPLLIPASVVQTSSDKTDKRVSPVVPSLPSPESPSGLAIHLYVHHHHHHHSQETVEKKSGTTSPPLLLLSPLTIEPSSKTANTTSPPLLPSPVSPPLATPQLVSLLPSANIPSRKDSISSSTSITPLSSTNIKSLTPTEEDTQAPLPWFNHPNSLANSSSSPSSSRPPRPVRLHQPRVRLPDPATSAHLLSTISPQDLSRLYVHAAHHLHSHQPIRRYVLMKMLMTQAELTQYGRLRAEMPRAPGPSTGALPKRTGFGTVANTGLGARCRAPSRLGRFVVVAVAVAREREETRKRAQERVGVEEEEGEGKMNKSKRLSWSMPSFSLSALTGGRTASHTKCVPLSEREAHPLLPAAAIDEKDACRNSMKKDGHHRRKQVKRQDSGCYASSRRLEELELGGGGDRLQTRRRSLTRSLSLSSSSDYEMEDMDDDEDDSGHEMLETQLDRSIRQEGEEDDYWTMLRQKNNRSRRRLIRMEDASVPEDKEDSSMYHYQQHPSSQQQQQPSRYYHQQQPLHQYMDQNAIQPSPPNLHHYQRNQHPQSISSSTSFLSTPTSASPKTLVRPPTKMSISPSKSLDRRGVSNTHHHTRGRENHQTLPIMGAVAASGGNGSSDSIGLSSGLLMVSLLFAFLYLIEGTNQFHNLQSALLSIIL